MSTTPLNKSTPWQLRTSSLLWVIWGLVHAAAGLIVMFSDAAGGFQGIADAVDPAILAMTYPDAVGAVLNQHGWNLLWGGLVTIVGGVLIWRSNRTAIWVTAMVGGLLDVGYFLFMDLGGFVKFVPGTLMTLVSATAIDLSFWVWASKSRR